MQRGPIPLKSIRTERLLIRPVKVQDAPLMHMAMKASFPQLKQWMPWAQSLASLRDTEVYLAQGERLWDGFASEGVEQPLQIFDLNEQIYYGATGIKPINLRIPSFEVGYWANQTYGGQGFITQAMSALTHYLFEVLHAKRVEINCEEKNERSAKVATRLNFELEGKLKNHRLDANQQVVTTLVYACTEISRLPLVNYHYQ